jgi:NAD(P)H-dependent FMN reductase
MKLEILITSTRPGRLGLPIGQWFTERAKQHGGFDVGVVDLLELALPMIDEPRHPRFAQYEHEHTKAWSRRVSAADAFVFVTPEYNHGSPPALINALDYLYREWHYKPAAFVSYGGISGGTRSVEMTKQVLPTLKIMPIPESVILPFAAKLVTEGVFAGTEANATSASAMLDELHRWATALTPMRAPAA